MYTILKFVLLMKKTDGSVAWKNVLKYSGPQDCWKYPAIAMEDTVIHKNDRICQFRIMKKQPEIHFETVKELSGKSRGGFGSTGKN